MMGWRARIGFLVPPGNPTVEPEMTELAPPGVSVHFTRMSASGAAGTHTGQEERNRSQIASLDEATRLAGNGLAPGHRHGPYRHQLHARPRGRGGAGPSARNHVADTVRDRVRQCARGADLLSVFGASPMPRLTMPI